MDTESYTMVGKKALMGIGTLIIFIAAILVSIVGATVILQTQTRLQSSTLRVADSARESIGTNVFLQSVKGIGDGNHHIIELEMMVKLSEGGSPMKLNDTIITLSSQNFSLSLTYGGTDNREYFTTKFSREIDRDINYTNARLKSDLDADYTEDYVRVLDSTTLLFDLSTNDDVYVTIPSILVPGTHIDDAFSITADGVDYGTVYIEGNTTEADVIDADMTFQIVPSIEGGGRYSVEFPLKGKNHVRDAIVFGDVMRVFLELPTALGESKDMSIDFMTPIGTPMEKRIKSPDIISEERVTLFP